MAGPESINQPGEKSPRTLRMERMGELMNEHKVNSPEPGSPILHPQTVYALGDQIDESIERHNAAPFTAVSEAVETYPGIAAPKRAQYLAFLAKFYGCENLLPEEVRFEALSHADLQDRARHVAPTTPAEEKPRASVQEEEVPLEGSFAESTEPTPRTKESEGSKFTEEEKKLIEDGSDESKEALKRRRHEDWLKGNE